MLPVLVASTGGGSVEVDSIIETLDSSSSSAESSQVLGQKILTHSLFLSRCQIDTPDELVKSVWRHVYELREKPIGTVVDFGAGDARFAEGQCYTRYTGFEIDSRRRTRNGVPANATVKFACAFSEKIESADLCIGNPPYVRNQDLPSGWGEEVANLLFSRTGVRLSGLANAWQYFFLLGLVSTKADGLLALVIPYEWVSRPSVRTLRDFIKMKGWDVYVYRLLDETFHGVMTTASITIIDKKASTGLWRYYEERIAGNFEGLKSETSSDRGVVEYLKRSVMEDRQVFAKRGLSPGTQKLLVLTEELRETYDLVVDEDVVPCVTTLRPLKDLCESLAEDVFQYHYRGGGAKCWLIRTDREPSPNLAKYLEAVDPGENQTVTCRHRSEWWRYKMPDIPSILAASGFTGDRPKLVVNKVGARAVGSVTGIYGIEKGNEMTFVEKFARLRLGERIVPHSNGLRKIEINQMNALIQELNALGKDQIQ